MPEAQTLAWTAIRGGHTVVDASGAEWGRVAEVLADRDDDIFHGLAVRTGAGSALRELPAAEIMRITEAAITTRIDAASAEALPEYAGSVRATIELELPPSGPGVSSTPEP